jgi:exopolysaccharide production protein ExoY
MTLPLRPDTTFLASPVHVAQVPGQSSLYVLYGKRVFDIALVVALAPLVVPLLAIIALIMLILGESPLFSQLRLGQNGRVFRIWKLRTMHADADALLADLLKRDPARRAEWERTQKLVNDPRVTPLGALLRKTSIDELPQLWNVLKGDMSMIGPRPMMVDQAPIYGPTLGTYFSLRPGISGQWQVTERNDANFSRRAQIDADYASNMTFINDLLIVIMTMKAVLRSTGH